MPNLLSFLVGAAAGSILTAVIFSVSRSRQRSKSDLVEHLRKEGLL